MTFVRLGSILELTDASYSAGYAEMSAARRIKCDAFRFPDDRKRCVLADMIVRRELSALTGIPSGKIEIRLSDKGKPFVEIPGVFFSVAHAGRYAGAAFSDREVGFDIELIRPVRAPVLCRFASPGDLRYVFGDAQVPEGLIEDPAVLRRFFEVWTFKEAVGKQMGAGLTSRLRSVSFDPAAAALTYPDGCVACCVDAAPDCEPKF